MNAVKLLRQSAVALDCFDALVEMIDPDQEATRRAVVWVDPELAGIVRAMVPKCAGDGMQRGLRQLAAKRERGDRGLILAAFAVGVALGFAGFRR